MGRLGWVALLVVLDLWTKSAVFRWLTPVAGQAPPEGVEIFKGHYRYTLWDPWFGFMLGENHGAAWGLGADYPRLLVSGRLLAVAFLAFLLWRAATRPRAMIWAFALVLAGALGNLHDNFFRRDDSHPIGAVRDFVDVYFARWDWHFPTFNVADACITVGAVLLVWSTLFGHREGRGEGRDAGSEGLPEAGMPEAGRPGGGAAADGGGRELGR